MTALLAGLVVLVLALQFLRWLGRVDVKTARKAINWGGLGLIALVILFLAVTGRIGAAIAGLVALVGWGGRLLGMVQMFRQVSGAARSFGFGGGFSRGGASNVSQVDSAYLRMTLDHGSGGMDGEVRQGRYQNRRLSKLEKDDLLSLLQDVQSDPDSVGLLEAYLDRLYPDWRDGGQGGSAPATQGAMTAAEAYRILGLQDGAHEDEIKAAYRKLMGQLHPDHGGSDYLAAKVNQAKDFLLKKGAGV